jgi:hypothetical protein
MKLSVNIRPIIKSKKINNYVIRVYQNVSRARQVR